MCYLQRILAICMQLCLTTHSTLTKFQTFVKRNKDATNNFFAPLQSLRDNDSVTITKPDKGRGVVILDKSDYLTKMFSILNDSSKSLPINIDTSTYLLKLEDKLNRVFRTIKSSIDDTTYHKLLASGSRPGAVFTKGLRLRESS